MGFVWFHETPSIRYHGSSSNRDISTVLHPSAISMVWTRIGRPPMSMACWYSKTMACREKKRKSIQIISSHSPFVYTSIATYSTGIAMKPLSAGFITNSGRLSPLVSPYVVIILSNVFVNGSFSRNRRRKKWIPMSEFTSQNSIADKWKKLLRCVECIYIYWEQHRRSFWQIWANDRWNGHCAVVDYGNEMVGLGFGGAAFKRDNFCLNSIFIYQICFFSEQFLIYECCLKSENDWKKLVGINFLCLLAGSWLVGVSDKFLEFSICSGSVNAFSRCF